MCLLVFSETSPELHARRFTWTGRVSLLRSKEVHEYVPETWLLVEECGMVTRETTTKWRSVNYLC